ncbi:MAG: tetratricopeptide repeat protein [Melioribacteraceae bacterium]
MRKLVPVILLIVLSACSMERETVRNDDEQQAIPKDYKQYALERFIQGSTYELQDRYDEAVREYSEAVKYDPKSGIYYSLAKSYFRLNRLDLALYNSKKAVSLDSLNKDYLYLLGAIFSTNKQNDSAAFCFEKVIKLDSTDSGGYFNLAEQLEATKPSESLKLYRKVIDMIGPEWGVLIKIADLNERLGNVKETIKTIEDLLDINPSSLELKKMLIESYIKNDNNDKAFEQIEEAMISNPEDVDLINYKGELLLSSLKYKEAAELYYTLAESDQVPNQKKIEIGQRFFGLADKDSSNLDYAYNIFSKIKTDSVDWELPAYLGEILLKEKKDSLAIEQFKLAAKLADWNPQLWVRLGGLLFDTGHYTQVVDLMKDVADKFPNDYAINLIYGLSLSQENNPADASKYLYNAVKINPNDLMALSAYGFNLNQLKKDEEAVTYLEKALIIAPDDIQTIGVLAMIYENRKQYSISDSLYQKALSLDAENILIMNNYAYSLSNRGIKLDESLEMSRKTVEKEPENSSYLDTLGWIYFKVGNYKEAEFYIKRAIEKDKNNATLLDHLGDVLFKKGEKNKAIEYWKNAFELDPVLENLKSKIEKGEL